MNGHLEGYDPSKAPKFVWPERLQKVKAEIRAQAVARGKAAEAGIERETREISGWNVHINKDLLTEENLPATEKALGMLKVQLDEIIKLVPATAVLELKKVPLTNCLRDFVMSSLVRPPLTNIACLVFSTTLGARFSRKRLPRFVFGFLCDMRSMRLDLVVDSKHFVIMI